MSPTGENRFAASIAMTNICPETNAGKETPSAKASIFPLVISHLLTMFSGQRSFLRSYHLAAVTKALAATVATIKADMMGIAKSLTAATAVSVPTMASIPGAPSSVSLWPCNTAGMFRMASAKVAHGIHLRLDKSAAIPPLTDSACTASSSFKALPLRFGCSRQAAGRYYKYGA